MRHNHPVNEHHIAEPRTASPLLVALFAVVAVILGGAALIALISAIGLPGLVMVAGVVGSFTFVVLTVSRRRPIGLD